jgi:hypothetical protein
VEAAAAARPGAGATNEGDEAAAAMPGMSVSIGAENAAVVLRSIFR